MSTDAAIFIAKKYGGKEPLNIGWGEDLTIREIACGVKWVIGYEGELVFDTNQPDEAPRKLLDTSPLRALGWTPARVWRKASTRPTKRF
jgi:GDP-L-fucose synthase